MSFDHDLGFGLFAFSNNFDYLCFQIIHLSFITVKQNQEVVSTDYLPRMHSLKILAIEKTRKCVS